MTMLIIKCSEGYPCADTYTPSPRIVPRSKQPTQTQYPEQDKQQAESTATGKGVGRQAEALEGQQEHSGAEHCVHGARGSRHLAQDTPPPTLIGQSSEHWDPSGLPVTVTGPDV